MQYLLKYYPILNYECKQNCQLRDAVVTLIERQGHRTDKKRYIDLSLDHLHSKCDGHCLRSLYEIIERLCHNICVTLNEEKSYQLLRYCQLFYGAFYMCVVFSCFHTTGCEA